jgi:hypothetical protein
MTEMVVSKTPKQLVSQINREHEMVETYKHNTIQHAIKCGELLEEAKAKVPHGEWLPWLEKNFDASEWTAQAYMRLARAADPNTRRVTDLEDAESLRSALRVLSSPEPKERGEEPQVDPDTPEGRLLAAVNTRQGVEGDELDGELVDEPRPGLSDHDQRKWRNVTTRIATIQRCIHEATSANLSDASAINALTDASQAARQAAIDLEQLAEGLRRQAA